MRDLHDGSVIGNVNVQTVWVMIHGHHISFLNNAVLLWEVLFGKCLYAFKGRQQNPQRRGILLTIASDVSPIFFPIS
jgi:hypothetical protein